MAPPGGGISAPSGWENGRMASFDLVLRGGTCVLPWGQEATDVGVRAGRIAALGDLRTAAAAETIDCTGLHVLPGLIDAHVHLRDPGDPKVETLADGTKGAMLGGLAAVFDMPNTAPAITDRERLDWKRDYLAGNAWCDVGIYVGASMKNIPELASLELQPNVCAVKVFAGSSTGDLLVSRRCQPGGGDAQRPAADRLPLGGRVPAAGAQAACSTAACRTATTWSGATWNAPCWARSA